MSVMYDIYIHEHCNNVIRGFNWLKDHIPELIKSDYDYHNIFDHDRSKYDAFEYAAYDAYFYGGNKSYSVVQNFEKAWLLHIHKNPHHWQHWVLINDEPGEGTKTIEMPYQYIIEMICDWWAFSWAKDDLYEIFKWYDHHKKHMILEENTRKTVESILNAIKERLDKEKKNDV